MTSLIADPQLLAAAAGNVADINSSISAARAAAAGPTTGLVAAAEDEVSAMTAALFGAYGQEYQAILQQAAAFHEQFVAALSSAGNAYTGAEAAASNALGTLGGDVRALMGGNAAPTTTTVTNALTTAAPTVVPLPNTVTLVLGASGLPIPPQAYIVGIPPLYIDRFFGAGTNIGIDTPEGLYPLTGINNLTFNVSVSQGLTILNNAIQTAVASGNTTVNVFGYSQSAAIASLEMQMLNPTNTPGGSLLPPGVTLNFTLVGDVSNPNGGLLARFPGLDLQSLGLTFGTATPDNSFPTRIYTIEYDGFADFPQYPINVLSDVNAFVGIVELHGTYPFFSATQLLPASQGGIAIPLTNTVGPTMDQYFILPTQNLPLLDPVRAIPLIGNPIADLVQPDLRVLVDLGYGSTTQGWSPDAPNVPTPFGVIPPVSPITVAGALATGTQQGISAFASDISAMMSSPPNLSPAGLPGTLMGSLGTGGAGVLPALTSALSSPTSFIAALQSANSNIVNAISSSASAAYATLLPTADIANALVTSLPSYDLNLFLDGVEQVVNGDPVGGLVYAFGAPVAANVALGTLATGFELRVVEHAATTIVGNVMNTYMPPPVSQAQPQPQLGDAFGSD
jgi:PE-PPE domain/PE family